MTGHATLVEILDLEQLDEDLFRGHSTARELPTRVFGGQVAAQALVAAGRTVVPGRPVHSLHAYFLRPGDTTSPIVYLVERIRTGRSFTTRQVSAMQDGEAIFSLTASFHAPETGPEYQHAHGSASHPEDAPPLDTWREQMSGTGAERWSRWVDVEALSVDLRFVQKPPAFLTAGETRPAHQQVWTRTREKLPDDPRVHCCVLTFLSDLDTLSVASLPFGRGYGELSHTSLDHAVWFHRPFRADDWLLHEREAPIVTGARGLTRTQVFDAAGQLVASVSMEGLLRPRG